MLYFGNEWYRTISVFIWNNQILVSLFYEEINFYEKMVAVYLFIGDTIIQILIKLVCNRNQTKTAHHSSIFIKSILLRCSDFGLNDIFVDFTFQLNVIFSSSEFLL